MKSSIQCRNTQAELNALFPNNNAALNSVSQETSVYMCLLVLFIYKQFDHPIKIPDIRSLSETGVNEEQIYHIPLTFLFCLQLQDSVDD